MTTMAIMESIGAPAASEINWSTIDWCQVESQVRRLQTRIAKAFREGKYNKAKALQWLLTHSFSARLLAVKRVVTNKGAKSSPNQETHQVKVRSNALRSKV